MRKYSRTFGFSIFERKRTEEELQAAEKEQADREALSDLANWKRKSSAMDFGGLRSIYEFNHNELRGTALIIFGCNTVRLIEWNAKDGQKQTGFFTRGMW